MSAVLGDIALVLVFVVVGGVFAAAEMSLVSLREGQVRALSERGRRGARLSRLHQDPNRFLAAVQVGVTLAGFLSAAFGAATLADKLSPVLERWGVGEGLAGTLSLILVTLVISYVSLVLGELAPKRLALQRAEPIALAVAPGVDRIATLARPAIWLLSKSTDLVVRMLGGNPKAAREAITEEELRDIVAGHETLSGESRRLITEVLDAGERQLHEVMVPRTEVDFLDASLPVYKAAKLVANSPRSRYPVVRGSHDEVVGFVHVRDLFSPDVAGRGVRLEDLARDVMLLPGTKQVLTALQEMRREHQHLAIVLDEYGGTDGIVTLEDLVEELVGDITDEYDAEAAVTRPLRGGSVEVDGLLNLEDFADRTGVVLPEGPYETVAGYVITALGRVPAVGDAVPVETAAAPATSGAGAAGEGDASDLAHRLVVTELDGRRVSRLRLEADAGTVGSSGTGTDSPAVADAVATERGR
ncbi:MAG: hemolysin family protein [Actinomycetes bacterium]